MNEIKQLINNTDLNNASSNLPALEALLYSHWHEAMGLQTDDYLSELTNMRDICTDSIPNEEKLYLLDTGLSRLEIESTLFYEGVAR